MGKNIGMKIGLSLCGLFVMISSFFAPSSVAATMPSYDLEHTFPSEPRDYKQVREPADVAFDLSGNAYVADYGYHTIIKYDATGQYVTHWELSQPIAISVDGTSNEVYVGRSVSNEVHIFDDNGNPLHTFGSSGSGDGEFDWIWDIAIDDKYIYVSDRSNHRVQIFNKSDRSFLTSVGENGAGDGQFNLPAGLAIGSDHQLYVADTNNGRIQLFTFDSGTSTWSYHSQLSITAPVSLHLEEDTSGAHILHVLERSGKSSSRVELTGHDLDAVDPTTVVNNPLGGNVLSGHINTKMAWNPVNEQRYAVDRTAIVRMDDIKDTANWIGMSVDQFNTAGGIAVDQSGKIYITDSFQHRILEYSPDGTHVRSWGKIGSGDGEFIQPRGIVVDSTGHIYVADIGNYRIQKFKPDGTYERQWGTQGIGDGKFREINAIAVDSSDNIYVASLKTVQKFDANGNHLMTFGNHHCDTSGHEPCAELGNFPSARGIGLDSIGNVYISGGNEVHKFTSSGTFLTRWGGNGSELGKFGAAGPGKIAIDQDDRVHVLDSSNYRLQVFDRDGTTVLGEFGYPPVTSGIIADFVIDQTKQLIVLDRNHYNVKIFKPRGSGPIADLAAEGGYKQVKLTFSAPNGATSVSVKQRESGALTWVDATTRYAVTALSTEAVVINLEDDTEYEFKLVITGGPHAGDSNIAAAKTFEPYEKISDLTGVGGYREVYLTFSPVTAATSVKVKVWDSTVGAWVDATTDAPITAGATSATVVGLEDDTEYFFYLEVTGGPRHGSSNQVNVRTNPPETPPGPISDLTATDGYRMVTLNFSAPHGATSVTVKQRESGAVLWSDATTLDPVTDRSMEAIVTELEHDTEYEFKLEVIGGPHAGDSNIATVRTFEGPIRDLAGVGGDREVHLTFSPVTGATSVVVKVWDSTAGVWVDATTDAPITDGATSATVIGLEDDTNYNIHLHVTGGRRGGTSNIVLVRTNPRATGPVTPVPLSNLTASGGDRSVTLSFSAPTGATSVTVKQRVQGETSWTDATTNAPITATSTHAVVTGLADNTTYEFYLVVVGGERAGDSNTAVATTNAATGADSIPPTWPGSSELTLSDITRTTVQLTWPAAQDNVAVKGYRIYVDGDQKVDKVSGDFNYSVTDDTYTYTVTGLNPNTTYEFDVKAYDAGNNVSEPGLSATATTLARQSSGGGRNIWLPSDNADMKLLEIRADGQLLTLEPSFDPEVTEYTVTTSARQVELTAVVQHYGAKGEWNGQTLDGTPIRIDLQQGENVIKLVVEAENRTTQTYTLTIVRTVPKSVEKEQGTDEAQTDGAFSDTAGHWAEADIREAVLKGFVRGYPDGTFRPNQPVTRAEFSVMLVEALQLDREASELTFTDLDQIGPWARRSVAIAVQTGIVSGYTDGRFRPNQQITRAEAAMMIAKALQLQWKAEDETPFADNDQIPHWAKGAVEAVHKRGIVNGRGENEFVPNGTTTRAEAVVMLLRILK